MDAQTLQIQKALGIDYPLAEKIKAICRPVKFNAGTTIQRRGVADTKGIFLLKGITKYAVLDLKGHEYVSSIDHSDGFLAYGCFGFFKRKKSFVNFIAVTDVEGLEVRAEELMPIVDKHPELYSFFIDAVIRRYLRAQHKEVSIIQNSSTMRYADFKEEYKEVIEDIPLKDIASFLNIKPGSLSRIRKSHNT